MKCTNYFNEHFSKCEEGFVDTVFEKISYEKESAEIGYYTLFESQKETVDEIKNYISTNELINGGTLKNIVIVGTGGSSLGAKAVDCMLKHRANRNEIELIFLENCDPINLTFVLKNVKREETLFIMISKSGSTIETASITKYLFQRYELNFSEDAIKRHFCVITDPNSPLDNFAKNNSIKAFYMPKNVGGRFSVFTAVGLLPLAILGYDIKKILEGSEGISKRFFTRAFPELINKAQYYAKYATQNSINVLFSYSSSLKELNAWYVQLWGESLGKINKQNIRVGLTPVGLVGSVDQHSFLQLIVQGPKDKSVTFIKVLDFEDESAIPEIKIPNLESTNYINGKKMQTLINAQCDATSETLIEQGVAVDLIEIERLNEQSCGELIYYFELLTSCVGAFLGINAYDQPGVEFGKKRLVEKFS